MIKMGRIAIYMSAMRIFAITLIATLVVLIFVQAAQARDWPVLRRYVEYTGTSEDIVELS